MVTLPGTVSGGKGEFRITTFISDPDSGKAYSVDTGVASNLYTITQGTFLDAVVTPASFDAYIPTKYEFSVTPEHFIP